jgi:hypothetical protein
MSLMGIELELVFDLAGMNPENRGPQMNWRPSEIVLCQRGRQHSLTLTWPPGTPTRAIRLDRGATGRDTAPATA